MRTLALRRVKTSGGTDSANFIMNTSEKNGIFKGESGDSRSVRVHRETDCKVSVLRAVSVKKNVQVGKRKHALGRKKNVGR